MHMKCSYENYFRDKVSPFPNPFMACCKMTTEMKIYISQPVIKDFRKLKPGFARFQPVARNSSTCVEVTSLLPTLRTNLHKKAFISFAT
jgi:hypothetical protein